MRVLSLSLMLSALVASGCAQAAADDELADQEMSSALAAEEPLTELDVVEQPAPAPAPVVEVRREVVYRDAPVQPVRQPVIVKKTNIKRDAAIGAGVGAVSGAIIHDRNRWKGAAVGAVLGGAAGAVVGATIDKRTEVQY